LGIICAIFPDADVIGFQLGISYSHFFGHRGFSHSLIFALLMAILIKLLFYRKLKLGSKSSFILIIYFFLCMASHGMLDALTTGGLGIAFFSPFDNQRYFFPLRIIQVSPIGAKAFFSDAGIKVITSELKWIGLPCLCIIIISWIYSRSEKELT
ncbi:MAG: metal-dependent hydrolase, partial [Flammeovirgaceae bacterium]|nr:metal-dependent hydrolase [Flammeovirgaceae bacterium]